MYFSTRPESREPWGPSFVAKTFSDLPRLLHVWRNWGLRELKKTSLPQFLQVAQGLHFSKNEALEANKASEAIPAAAIHSIASFTHLKHRSKWGNWRNSRYRDCFKDFTSRPNAEVEAIKTCEAIKAVEAISPCHKRVTSLRASIPSKPEHVEQLKQFRQSKQSKQLKQLRQLRQLKQFKQYKQLQLLEQFPPPHLLQLPQSLHFSRTSSKWSNWGNSRNWRNSTYLKLLHLLQT